MLLGTRNVMLAVLRDKDGMLAFGAFSAGPIILESFHADFSGTTGIILRSAL